ncbi:flagellar hook assembly protein FlgD [Salidesulfovibrio onnuriiensis]|uniref:flagellar hook assembly protein FlgD n=1 Tax=Salidesulfovibrio onnuriiensis TaxID=2583823 RepID=UPI0011CC373F|nr:flagellar hook capping FlgD N-terminal domain-containing protein [Salidesulfovibrio onnuriiensis]
MYTSSASYLNSVYTSSTTSWDTEESSTDLGQDEFLQLFVAQLENQDPLDPVDDSESIAQMAEFSSLEQLTNINSQISDLIDTINTQTLNTAVSYIGKSVVASGYSMSKEGETISDVTYTVPVDVEDLTAHIIDEDGSIVNSIDLGAHDAGEYDFSWDGTGSDGEELEDGLYSIAFTATNSEGESVSISTMVSGVVSGVSQSSGSTLLTLEDGRQVYLSNVYEVTA